MKFNGQTFHRVCSVGSPYSLFLYLCDSTMEQIKDTMFIYSPFGENRLHFDCLPGQYLCDSNYLWTGFKAWLSKQPHIAWLPYLYEYLFHCPHLQESDELYAQDFTSFGTYLCAHDYTLIEDSPCCFSAWTKQHHQGFVDRRKLRSSKSYRFQRLLKGGNVGYFYGDSPHCKGLLLTEDDDAEYVRHIPRKIIHPVEMWSTFSPEKKALILHLYGTTQEDIEQLKTKPIVIYTQPLYPDCISKDDYIDILKRLVARYPKDQIVIKTHPREAVDMKALFPDVMVFEEPLPAQIIDAEGVHFKKAVTFFSSSVQNLSYPVDIDWYGTDIHPAIAQKYYYPMPEGARKCKL